MTSKIVKFDDYAMILALDEAKMASLEGEVPVGCVIINRSTREIVSSSHNMMQKGKNANLHAEIIAINDACKKTNNKNLSDYDIYITLEPCTMCASAISNARLGRVYYGASDVKQGAVENGVRFFASSSCQHRPEIYPDIQKESSEKIMTDFFKQLRES